MKFELIPATAQHRVYLLALRKLTMTEHLEQAGVFLTDEEHLLRVDHRYDCFHLIVCDGQIAGALKYIVDKQEIEVLQLQIHPQYQGQGLGKRVMNHMIGLAQTSDQALVLKVLKANPAKQLYQQLGFVVTGQDELEFHMRFIAVFDLVTAVPSA